MDNSTKERLVQIVSTWRVRSGLSVRQIVAAMQKHAGCSTVTSDSFYNWFMRSDRLTAIPADWVIALIATFTKYQEKEQGICKVTEAIELAMLVDFPIIRFQEMKRLFEAQHWQPAWVDACKKYNVLADISTIPSLIPSIYRGSPRRPIYTVGREQELAEIQQLLGKTEIRLLTLTGSPGVGKTTLAYATAHAVESMFIDGFRLINLNTVTHPADVLSITAHALNIVEGSNQLEQLIMVLRNKSILLVLDNFEHVLQAAPLINDLLIHTSKLKILVTSRCRLNISTEYDLPIYPLHLPDRTQNSVSELAHNPAVALFTYWIQRHAPRCKLAPKDIQAVADICVYLEGIPLAIELAAARVRILSPQKLRKHIITHNPALFDILKEGPLDYPERNRGLRTSIADSYNLLSEAEKRLFAQLSVFQGNFLLEAVENVCTQEDYSPQSITELLERLVNWGLVQLHEQVNEITRFTMLRVIWLYADEQLTRRREKTLLCQRHAQYYRTVAEAEHPPLAHPHHGRWLEKIEYDYPHFQAALRWASEQDDMLLFCQLCALLWPFWWARRHRHEGYHWLKKALTLPTLPSALHAQLLLGAGTLAHEFGAYADAYAYLHTLFDAWQKKDVQEPWDTRIVAQTLLQLGMTKQAQGRSHEAREYCRQSIDLWRDCGDLHGLAHGLDVLGMISGTIEDYAHAKTLLDESLALYRQLEDTLGVARVYGDMGLALLLQENAEAALPFLRQSVVLRRRIQNPVELAMALSHLGFAALFSQHLREAFDAQYESLMLRHDVGHTWGISYCLYGLAGVAALQGQATHAAYLLSAARKLQDSHATPLVPAAVKFYDRYLALVHEQLGAVQFSECWQAGQNMEYDQMLAYASQVAPSDGL